MTTRGTLSQLEDKAIARMAVLGMRKNSACLQLLEHSAMIAAKEPLLTTKGSRFQHQPTKNPLTQDLQKPAKCLAK